MPFNSWKGRKEAGIRMLRERAARRAVGAPAEYPLHPLERMVIEDEARHKAMCQASWEAVVAKGPRTPPEDTIEHRVFKECKAAYLATVRGADEVKDAISDATETTHPVPPPAKKPSWFSRLLGRAA